MTQNKYDTLMKTLADYGNLKLESTYMYSNSNYYYDDRYEHFILRSKTGEDSGGSCWGGVATYSAINEPRPDFEILDVLLLELDPDFSLCNYRKIISIVKTEQGRSSEYYGNGYYYDEKILDKEDFLKALNELGFDLNDKLLTTLEEKIANRYLAESQEAQKLRSKNRYY